MAQAASRRCRDPLGERMRGVDDRGYPVLSQPAGKRVGTAEAADPYLAGRQSGTCHAAGERRRHRHPALVEIGRESACFGGAPEYQDHRG